MIHLTPTRPGSSLTGCSERINTALKHRLMLYPHSVAGQAEPPIFPQRPFTYPSVVNTEYPSHDLGAETFCLGPDDCFYTSLDFTAATSGSGFGLLAPSISNMVMNEGEEAGKPGQLTIYGIFGTDPWPDGSVQVGGTIEMKNGIPVVTGGKSVNIESWDPGQIVVDLPLSENGSAGNVQVIARQHVSNVAQLTEWRSQMDQFSFTISGPGSLLQQQNFAFHLRADIRKWRKVIHQAPIEPDNVPIASASDSEATVISSGSYPAKSGDTYKWKGSPKLVNFFGAPAGSNTFFLTGTAVDSTHMTFAVDDLALLGGTCSACNSSGTCTPFPLFVQGPFGWFSSWSGGPAPSNTEFEYSNSGDSVSIKKGSMSGSGIGLDCTPVSADADKGDFTWA